MIKKILVPIDGSAHSKKALEFACDVATRFYAQLQVITVIRGEAAEQVVMVFGRANLRVPAPVEDIEKAGQPLIDAATELARARGCSIAQSKVVAGSVAKEILGFADEQSIDTIVIGSRGLSDLGGLLLGSVSHKVSHLATCSCIVVR